MGKAMSKRHLPVVEAEKCISHPERPATHRIKGEEDSFGCDWLDLCDECYKEVQEAQRKPYPGKCDFCGKDKPNIGRMRDTLDEGLGGPGYWVCDECASAYHRAVHEELKELARWNPDFQDPDCDYDDWDF